MRKRAILSLMAIVCITFAAASAFAWDCEDARSPGYWKNHPEAWPVETIDIGGQTYTKAEAIEIMQTPVRGDKFFTMFKAAVATFLNVENGSCRPLRGAYYFRLADEWLTNNPSVVRARSDAWQCGGEEIYWLLDAYNNTLYD